MVIEADGAYHNDVLQAEYDVARTCELEKLGLKVISFTNEDIIDNLEVVLKIIHKYLLSIE